MRVKHYWYIVLKLTVAEHFFVDRRFLHSHELLN